MNELIRRQKATKKTRDKFLAKPFSWENSASCAHMFRSHAVNMGHVMPKMPRIKSAIGAKRALKERNWKSVVDMMDHYFPRINVSEMLIGDMAALPSDDEFGALVICVGDKFIGWHGSDETGLKNIIIDDLNDFSGAWRL